MTREKSRGIYKNLVEGRLVDSLAVRSDYKKVDNHNRNKNNKKTQPTAKYPDHQNSIHNETQGGGRRNIKCEKRIPFYLCVNGYV